MSTLGEIGLNGHILCCYDTLQFLENTYFELSPHNMSFNENLYFHGAIAAVVGKH